MFTAKVRSVFVVFALLAGFVRGEEVKPPLRNAEDALAYFRQTCIPALVKATGGGERNPVTTVHSRSLTIRCGWVLPEDIRKDPAIYRVRWPEGNQKIITGSIEKAKETKNETWVISYSTGELGSLQAHLDALTGEVLMAFLIPEG